jgi:hypothetical protein
MAAPIPTDKFTDFFVEILRFASTHGSKGAVQNGFLRYKPWASPPKASGALFIFTPQHNINSFPSRLPTPAATLQIFEEDGHLTAFRQFSKVTID